MSGYYDGAPWLEDVRKSQKIVTYKQDGKTRVYTTAYDQDWARDAYLDCCKRHGRKEQKIYDVEEGTLESDEKGA